MKQPGRFIAAAAFALTFVLVGPMLPVQALGGALDPQFGGDGIVGTPVGRISSTAFDVAVQADGKILAAGSAALHRGGGSEVVIAVVRYRPGGSLDDTFGGDGVVLTRIRSDASGRGLAVQPDGRIVVAGNAEVNGRFRFAVARYMPNGALDRTFSRDGVLTTAFRTTGAATASDVSIQPDGRIVVAGTANVNGRERFAVARYKANGLLDPTFGGDGRVTTAFGSSGSASDVAIQRDGRIVAVGSGSLSRGTGFAVARYTPRGSLDRTFGGDGKVLTVFRQATADGAAVAIQHDGKVVVGGSVEGPPTGSRFGLVRYGPHGHLDPEFGSHGRVVTSFGHGFEGVLEDTVIQRDGRIVAAGWRRTTFITHHRFAVCRYTPLHGGLDPTFGGDGRVFTRINTEAYALGVALQTDGKIVAAGETFVNRTFRFAVARYLGA
jgi:uncharacterized delta-60 repeat protein